MVERTKMQEESKRLERKGEEKNKIQNKKEFGYSDLNPQPLK